MWIIYNYKYCKTEVEYVSLNQEHPLLVNCMDPAISPLIR